MRRIVVAVVSASVLSHGLSAQESEDRISGKASLGYLATDGNTDSENVNAAFNLVYALEVWAHEFDLMAVSAKNAGQTTAKSSSFAYDARRELGELGYLVAALDWKQDRFSSYDQTESESVGYGRHLIAAEGHTLNLEGGFGARQNRLRDGTEEDDAIVRAALDYRWTVNEATSFNQDLVVESGSSNTSVESVSELRARLFENLALVLSYRIRNNSDVLPGTEKADRFTAISLEYAF